MIYKYTSSKTIIAKVFRDLGIQDSDWINFAIEWIGESLEHIGTYSQTIPKIHILKNANFRAKLPNDLYILDEIRYSNSTSTTQPTAQDFNFILSSDDSTHHPSLFGAENPYNENRVQGYILKGNYIHTSFESKWIAISYRAFYLDDDGYPMIPDSAEFQEALFWYITMKMLLRGQKHPVINYENAEQRWLKYAGQARNASNMPDKSQYRSFHEKWVQMVPQYDRDLVYLYSNVKQPIDFLDD